MSYLFLFIIFILSVIIYYNAFKNYTYSLITRHTIFNIDLFFIIVTILLDIYVLTNNI